jgi:hypothetical protein
VRWLNVEPVRQSAWLALPRRWIDAGEVLQSVGQSQSAVWFVEQGLLRSHFLNADGRERNCAFHTEWHWAGMPPPRGEPVIATFAIDAMERSHVVELSHAALAAWRVPGMGTILEVQVLPQADHSERSETQLREGDRSWRGSVNRNREPMDKNRIRGNAQAGRAGAESRSSCGQGLCVVNPAVVR